MNLYKFKTSASSKFILAFMLCLLFEKPTLESYKPLTKLSQTSKLIPRKIRWIFRKKKNFNTKTVSHFKCKVKGNYKHLGVVYLSEGVSIIPTRYRSFN